VSKDIYNASWQEWLGYGLAPLLSYSLLFRWLRSVEESSNESSHSDLPSTASNDAQDWAILEPWLQTDAPAMHDILGTGNFVVAERLEQLLQNDGTRSIGIVAPFGAGKSTVVKWIKQLIIEHDARFILSEHSCWGFETSSASIKAMLTDTISKLGEQIDTFQVSSLPESYRQTFSAGGEWLDSISKIFFGQRDSIEQFRRLSILLGDMNERILFIIEDLDRNNSRSFDIQEVLAFLQQLKAFPNLSFILTGDLSPRIDFAKLCDHFEDLPPILPHQSGKLVLALRERCLNQGEFPHFYLGQNDNQWEPNQWPLRSGETSLSEAIAQLLNTPRALRNVLALTYHIWPNLYGEIDFDHLLVANVLRYAAPEAFHFIRVYGHHFRGQPLDSKSLNQEWDELCVTADWDVKAARTLIYFILPETSTWLENTEPPGQRCLQGLHNKRYWDRAMKWSIGDNEVRDQAIIQNIRQWISEPSDESVLVEKLCSSETYSIFWKDLADHFFANDREQILQLCEQVLMHIRQKEGAKASSKSQGFIAVLRYANQHITKSEDNLKWLQDQITEASRVSLQLVYSLWYYWAGDHSIIRPEDRTILRRHIIDVLQQELTTVESLKKITHSMFPYVFYQLVFDPGDNDHELVLAEPESWGWMGPILLEGVQDDQVMVAVGICYLVSPLDRNGLSKAPSDLDLLRSFFGDNVPEVIDSIDRLILEIDVKDREFVKDVVQSVRSFLHAD
jgi:hypothetical protein